MLPMVCSQLVMEHSWVVQWLLFNMPEIETNTELLIWHCSFLHCSGFHFSFWWSFCVFDMELGIASLAQLQLCPLPVQLRVYVYHSLMASLLCPHLSLISLFLSLLDHFHIISTEDVVRHHLTKSPHKTNYFLYATNPFGVRLFSAPLSSKAPLLGGSLKASRHLFLHSEQLYCSWSLALVTILAETKILKRHSGSFL